MNKRKILALLLAVVMICSLFVSPALAAEDEGIVAISDNTEAPKFTDLEEGHWAESAIIRWAEEGIIEGDGNGTINPARSLKRAELATILTRLLGLKDKASADTFSDVAADAWYADAVLKCAKAGIMLGDGTGKANPEAPIDRQQTIVMVGRALGVKPATGHSLDRFDDGDTVADWAAPYMIALTDKGILNGLPTGEGDGAIVAPTVNIDRASTFTLLDKAIAQYITAPCTVTVDDANKFVVINSAAEETGTVTVTGTTAGVVVATGTTDEVVLKNADVGTLKVDAPVDVLVSKGSTVTDLDANAPAVVTNNGTVTNLNTNADDVTFDGNKPSKVNTAEDVKPATDSKGNEVTEAPTTSGGGSSSSGGNRPSTQSADVVVAPSVDQGKNGFAFETVTGSVTVTGTQKSTGVYDVKLTATGVKNHTNAAATPADGHWVGFGMPVAPAGETYSYWVDGSEVESIAERTYTASSGKTYNTVYFSENTEADFKAAAPVIVVKNSANETVATYNVTFDVTFYKATGVTIGTELMDPADAYFDQFFPANIGLTATKEGNVITLTGVVDPGTLNKNSGATDPKEYTYYSMSIEDENIVKVANNGLGELTTTDAKFTLAARIWDSTANKLLKVSHAYELKDAAGRVQDTFTVTVDATACTVKGMSTATFKDFDGTVVGTQSVEAGGNVTTPAAPARDGYYFTGWGVKTGENETTVHAANTQVGIAQDTTFTAQYVEIGTAVAGIRPNGVAGDDTSFSYADAYTAAGIGYANGHITVDQNKTVALLNAAKGNDAAADMAKKQLAAITQMSGGEEANCLFIGLAVAAPEGATTLFVDDDEKTFPSVDHAGHDVFQDAEGKYYYISYYPGIKADGSVCAEKTWPAEQLVWKKGTEVIKVETLTVTRDAATPAEFTVKFVDLDGKAIEGLEDQTVAYQGKAAKPEAVDLNGKLILGYYTAADQATAFDFTQGITANTTVYVDAETYEVAGVHAFDYACYDTADQRGTGAYWTALAYKMENTNSKANHVKNSEGVWTSNLLLIAADKLDQVAKLDNTGKLVVATQSTVNVGQYVEQAGNNVLWINATADNENLHDMGMTFKLGETEKTATWFFWYKEASDATPVLYKAVYEVPAAPEGIEVGTTKWEPTLFQEEMVPVTNAVVDLTWGATIVDGVNTYAEGKNAPAVAEPTTPGGDTNGEDNSASTASLSAAESESVTAPVDAIVPADEEIAEIPVMD